MIDVTDLQLLGSGSVCRCYALSDRLAIKCYRQERQRNIAFENQLIGWRNGLGPEPWGKRTVVGDERGAQFAYISRRAKVARDIGYDSEALRALGRRLVEVGLNDYDLCGVNAGFIGNRLVCIDFDAGSMGG